jgi:hypothetical protein
MNRAVFLAIMLSGVSFASLTAGGAAWLQPAGFSRDPRRAEATPLRWWWAVTDNAPARRTSGARHPWQWSDRERLAERSNDASAARRAAGRRAAEPHVYDVIDGSDDPHLFFEFELFDQMMRMAYAGDALTREVYREMKDPLRQSTGLPQDFWDRVGAIAAAYRHDVLEERRLGLAKVRSPQHEAEQDAVSLQLCRDRHAALAALRQEFPRFSEFLYSAIAPNMSMTSHEPAPELEQVVVGGCR